MLDLDLNVGSSESTQNESGTSNSSVININAAAAEDDSCSNLFSFNFDILNNDVSTREKNHYYCNRGGGDEVVVVTKELFPMMTSDSSGRGEHVVNDGIADGQSGLMDHRRTDLSFNNNNDCEITRIEPPPPLVKKSRRGPRSRSSQYRGVTFYRRTGRWESHIWDCGKQVYLGGFDTAHSAARAYDRAAIKFRGAEADINFVLSDYEDDLKQMTSLSKEEFVHILRRQSTGFSRGSSKFRGVTLHKCGQWEARMGQFLGKKAYDKAAIKCNGMEAVINFDPSTYEGKEMNSKDINGAGAISDPNLNLNLGISSSTVGDGLQETKSLVHPQYDFGPYDTQHNGRRSKMENPTSATTGQITFQGISVASDSIPPWPGMYPQFFPCYKENGSEKRMQSYPNWVWQMHGRANATPMPLFSSAASSGFSSSVTFSSPSSGNHLPKHPNDPSGHTLCFASPAANNSSQYYYHLQPFPPPP